MVPICLNNFVNILAKTIKYKESFNSNFSKIICSIFRSNWRIKFTLLFSYSRLILISNTVPQLHFAFTTTLIISHSQANATWSVEFGNPSCIHLYAKVLCDCELISVKYNFVTSGYCVLRCGIHFWGFQSWHVCIKHALWLHTLTVLNKQIHKQIYRIQF